MLKRIVTLLVLAPLAAVASNQTSSFMLDNGMQLVVREDHRSPTAVVQIWYRIGAALEHTGITGLSHALEHMMFKETKNHEEGEFTRIIQAQGGVFNAFTSKDYTAYFVKLPASRVETALTLEADRMQNLLLSEDDFTKEMEVIKEERRLSIEDKPESLLYERFLAHAYVASTYRNPVIGWMDDLNNMQLDVMQQWYKKWYSPNNAIVVVVGDVDTEQVKQHVNKYFGNLKPQKLPPTNISTTAEPLGEKRVIVKANAKVPSLLMGFNVPVVNTASQSWEPYALEVLAAVIDGGKSARLETEIIRKQKLASSTWVSYDIFGKKDNLLMVGATPTPDVEMQHLEEALLQQMDKLRIEEITASEMERVKAQLLADRVYARDSVMQQAIELGRVVSVGLKPEIIDEYIENIKKITPLQVKLVAGKYLIRDRLTVAMLQPVAEGE